MSKELSEYIDNAQAQLRKGVLEFSVMLSIAGKELYASDIINLLREHNLLVVEGTLYPILSRLKAAQLVSYNWVESSEGPPRKYYRLTDKGKNVLEKLSTNYQSLSQSINKLITQS
jgi:PadR family transcriptional regulator PadR